MKIIKKSIYILITSLVLLFVYSNIAMNDANAAIIRNDTDHGTAVTFSDSNGGSPDTKWVVRAQYQTSTRGYSPFGFYTSGTPGSGISLTDYRARDKDKILWMTACVDPLVSPDFASIDLGILPDFLKTLFGWPDGFTFHYASVDVTCDRAKRTQYNYIGCDQPNGLGIVAYNRLCPANRGPECIGAGQILGRPAVQCETGTNYCGSNTDATRCNTYSGECRLSPLRCVSVLRNTNVPRCLGVNGCQCFDNGDCTNRCGTGTWNQCQWQVRRCSGVHQCYVFSSTRDERCTQPSAGGTNTVCYNNSHCNQATHYCRQNSTGNCGVCRPYGVTEGRVYVDRNWANSSTDNTFEPAQDWGLGGKTLRRRNFNDSAWEATTTTSNPTGIGSPGGWYAWNANSPFADRIRTELDQDVVVLRSGFFELGAVNLDSNIYRPFIRSVYNGNIQTGNRTTIGSPTGYRRDRVSSLPEPPERPNANFLLRHKSYSISGTVYIDSDGSGDLTAADQPVTNYPGIVIRAQNPADRWNQNTGTIGVNIDSTDGSYQLPNPATNTPGTFPQRYFVYGETYRLSVANLPQGFAVINGVNATDIDFTVNDPATNDWSGTDPNNDILIARAYNISGSVFNDIDGDGVRAGANEVAMPNIVVSTDDGSTITTDAAGAFSLLDVPEGNRTVTIDNLASLLPENWVGTYPQMAGAAGVNLRPSTDVTLGEFAPFQCDVSGYNTGLETYRGNNGFPTIAGTASCIWPPTTSIFIGSIENLSFGIRINPPDPWLQGIGGDMRADSTNSLENNIPTDSSEPTLQPFLSIGSLPNLFPGIVFGTGINLIDTATNTTENIPLSNSFGRYIDLDYAQNSVKMSYVFIDSNLRKNGITPTTICSGTTSNCNILAEVGAAGGEFTSGTGTSLTIGDATNPPATVTFSGGEDYIIMVNGDLTINDNIVVDTNTTVFFIASGSILINDQVENLQGIYSAGGTFNTGGNHVPNSTVASARDVELEIQGSVIAGNFENLRDLDYDNENFPSTTIRFRPDFVINSPPLIRFTNYKIREIPPGDRDSQAYFNNDGNGDPAITLPGGGGGTPTPTRPPVTATPTPTPTPTPRPLRTVDLIAIEDTFARSDRPTTNFGSGSRLRINGNPRVVTYMKFNTSPIRGKSIQSATLRIHVSNDAGAGSNQTYNLKAITSSWSEGSVTWQNKPALPSQVLRSFRGAGNNQYININMNGLVNNSSTRQSWAIARDGTNDEMILQSSEAGTVGYRPRLTVQYYD